MNVIFFLRWFLVQELWIMEWIWAWVLCLLRTPSSMKPRLGWGLTAEGASGLLTHESGLGPPQRVYGTEKGKREGRTCQGHRRAVFILNYFWSIGMFHSWERKQFYFCFFVFACLFCLFFKCGCGSRWRREGRKHSGKESALVLESESKCDSSENFDNLSMPQFLSLELTKSTIFTEWLWGLSGLMYLKDLLLD